MRLTPNAMKVPARFRNLGAAGPLPSSAIAARKRMRGRTGTSPQHCLGNLGYWSPTGPLAVLPAEPAPPNDPAWEAEALMLSRLPAKVGAETMERRTKAMKSLRIGCTP